MLSHLRARVRNALHHFIRNQGYQIQPLTPLDLRNASTSPRDLILEHASVLRQSLLLNVPVFRCRSELGTRLDERHPFVITLADGAPEGYVGSTLESYYQQCQPSSATEVLDIPREEAPGFAALHPHAYVMPWSSSSPKVLQQQRARWMEEHATRNGYRLDMSDGYIHYGPVSVGKGELELERLRTLYHSVSRQGFRRSDEHDGDIVGRFLLEVGGDWCFLIRSGQHRIAVAAALGIASVPVRVVDRPIKREEVEYWPQVVAERISSKGALAVFDRVMRGDPPRSCQFSLSDHVDTLV